MNSCLDSIIGWALVNVTCQSAVAMEYQLTRELFLIAKYQHWMTTNRRHEWIVFGENGQLGFYRHTRNGHRVLEFQGYWVRGIDRAGVPCIFLHEFACCTHASVIRHNLCFRPTWGGYVWTSSDENRLRSFFPFLRTQCPRWALFTFIEWLDRFTSGEDVRYDLMELGDDDEWEVVV